MNNPADKAWYKLDNAAKIFPPTSSKSDTKVFRFSCELREIVDGDMLQSALDRTMDDFTGFQYVLKCGMFWYYLEQSDLRPIAYEENAPPCSTNYLDRKMLLFDVTWYGKRINLEVYHVLSDGTGAMQFLRLLVLNYLKSAHPDTVGTISGIDYDASNTQKMTDSFNKYYDRNKKLSKNKKLSNEKKPAAYQVKGTREAEWRLNIIEGSLSAGSLVSKAREYETSVTVLVTALFMRAIYGEMSVQDGKKPVVISVPVNLRKYFDSKSTRNFFSLVDVKYYFHNNTDSLENIIKHCKECLSEHLNEEYLQARLNKLLNIERNFFIRLLPLFIKNIFLYIAFSLAAREVTAVISNLGNIQMPEEVKPYIKLFDVFISTNKPMICICSYEDKMNISFTSPFISTDIQCSFFRQLTQMGIAIEISANDLKRRD